MAETTAPTTCPRCGATGVQMEITTSGEERSVTCPECGAVMPESELGSGPASARPPEQEIDG
ncbi:MAG TPA: hypothetical protein VLA66_04695 [Thermoanaerobaculia bacterium]|nr:hypothetical protein [Thermoanaerobaculia bacterium]